ncbi:MAG: hypothetical protein R3B93_10520 [Bacteroidia bacterium]
MVYVKFPHQNLLNHADYTAWLQKRDNGNNPDWKELFDWLGEHTRIAHTNDPILNNKLAKCWYSEMPVAAKNGKDVEHFRPKNEASQITNPQRQKLRQILGFDIPQAPKPPDGYKWLEFEPKNYRMSHPHVNRTGSKGSVFPILLNSTRLSSPQIPEPDQTTECNYLIDPSHPEDSELFWVAPDGEIIPRFPNAPLPADPQAQWNSDAMKNIRAHVSIVVYDLQHTDLKRGRQGVYSETRETLDTLNESITTGSQTSINRNTLTLFRLASYASYFSLAARCAMSDYMQNLGNSTTEDTVRQIVQNMIAGLRTLERN